MATRKHNTSSEVSVPQVGTSPADAATEAVDKEIEKKIDAIIAKGKKKGFLTYDEINKELPDDAVNPNRLDKLLSTLDQLGITLIDDEETEEGVV